jgi:hypothetical protein
MRIVVLVLLLSVALGAQGQPSLGLAPIRQLPVDPLAPVSPTEIERITQAPDPAGVLDPSLPPVVLPPPQTGIYEHPLPRHTEVLRDFLAPLPSLPMPPAQSGIDAPVSSAEAPEPAPPLEPLSIPETPPPTPDAAAAASAPDSPEALALLPDPEGMQRAFGDTPVGGVTLPAIALHPEGFKSAAITYSAVLLPNRENPWQRLFLLVHTGLADPIVEPAPAEDEAMTEETELDKPAAPSGPPAAQARITVGDRIAFNGDIAEHKWTFRAVDVTEFAGQILNVTFSAATLDPEAKDVVAAFGRPVLILAEGPYFLLRGGRGLSFGFSTGQYPRNKPGLALAYVRCIEPSSVRIAVNEAAAEYALDPGEHWLPLLFEQAGRFAFTPLSGDPKLYRLDLAPFSLPPLPTPVLPPPVEPMPLAGASSPAVGSPVQN